MGIGTATRVVITKLRSNMGTLISAPEVGKRLGKHRATVCNWVRQGKLVPTMQLGRAYYFAPEYIEQMKPFLLATTSGRKPASKAA